MAGEGSEFRGRRIPEATVVRLPVYQRILSELLAGDQRTVSSEQLAVRARVNAAKVRKDLSHLGSFGTRGTGYDAALLVAQIDRALGADRDWPIAIVGIGNLGRALANSEGFSSHGFRVGALLDADPAVVGTMVGSVRVRHIDDLATVAAEERPAVGVVATPAAVAQEVTDALVSIGVPSILNFASRVLTVPPHVVLRNVDLSIELQVMSFYQARSGPGGVDGPVSSLGVVGRDGTGERRRAGRRPR
ncbi:MAG TPA: redox-sensing transcriptional repressor Rex [Acidimicrobiales bacterium]|nr:redox-sensing transcriptional repressor Rex [Acidimicrobiales bacterium]